MDILVNMYFYRQKLIDNRDMSVEKLSIQHLGPGVLMHEYCREYGITPIVTREHSKYFLPTLLKLGCPTDLDLFKPKDFNTIEKLDGWGKLSVSNLKYAIEKCEYKLIDTAEFYQNEQDVGKALIGFENVYCVSKLKSTFHGNYDVVKKALMETLEKIQRNKIDLFLIHITSI